MTWISFFVLMVLTLTVRSSTSSMDTKVVDSGDNMDESLLPVEGIYGQSFGGGSQEGIGSYFGLGKRGAPFNSWGGKRFTPEPSTSILSNYLNRKLKLIGLGFGKRQKTNSQSSKSDSRTQQRQEPLFSSWGGK